MDELACEVINGKHSCNRSTNEDNANVFMFKAEAAPSLDHTIA